MVLVNLDAKPFGSCEHCHELLKTEEEVADGFCENCRDEFEEVKEL